MSGRNPRKDPAPGDVLEFRIGAGPYWGKHVVREIKGGEVIYWDEGILDHVPLARWRSWYVGRRNIRVTAAPDAARQESGWRVEASPHEAGIVIVRAPDRSSFLFRDEPLYETAKAARQEDKS